MKPNPSHAESARKGRPAAAASGAIPALRALNREETTALAVEGGFPAFRGKQLFHWVHRHGAESLDEMKNLPKAMREWLAINARMGGVEIAEIQGPPDKTQKIVWRLADGKFIESVVMRDQGKGRTSLCVSSQVGCAVGCTFCLTGYGGFQRQCSVDEIVGQVLGVRRHFLAHEEPIHTIVFMGMGEPMLNLDAVIKAVEVIGDDEGIAISPRRVTVSTSGIVPGIEKFGRADTGANLAVSLNATTDEIRTSIMPLNKKWPIVDVIRSLEKFQMKPRQRITVEYVLLKGINDSPADARELVKLLRGVRCKINLIMFNKHELLHYKPVNEETLDMFMRVISQAEMTVSVRWSKGREIDAACGQLAAHYFHKDKPAEAETAEAVTAEPVEAAGAERLDDSEQAEAQA